MAGELFLVARVGASALSESLAWVTSTDAPYEVIDPVDFDDELLDAIYEMYRVTYSAIDERFNIPDSHALFEYDRWILIDDDAGNLLGFVLLKTTAFGLKIGLAASDRSAEGRGAVRSFHERVFFVDGVYAEVSDAMERIASKNAAPRVAAAVARRVLADKKLEAHEDGYHYTRSITGIGDRVKIMVGKPEI